MLRARVGVQRRETGLERYARRMQPFLALLVAVATLACAAPDRNRQVPAVLAVASDLDNAPFASVDEHSVPRGRDVEMMQLLALELGTELEWKRMPFAELLPAVEAGRVDVVCATLGVTPERAERVDFTRPYFVTQIAVVVRLGAGEPTQLSELAGRLVGAGTSTTAERAVRGKLPRSIGVFERKEPTSYDQIRSREVDALVMDGPAADALVAAHPSELARLAESLDEERYALVLPRSRKALLAQVDAALLALEQRGELAALDRKFGLER